MKSKIALILISFIVLISCREEKKTQSEEKEIEKVNSTQETGIEKLEIDRENLITQLQGIWKEEQYPFRKVEFKDSEVKFTEEGLVEEPIFQEFKILPECPFAVNNIKNVDSGENILVMLGSKTCEKLKISEQMLTLSGFNTNTQSEYFIIYKKVE